MYIISIKESPEYKDKAIQYFQSKWASPNSLMIYEDCIANCITLGFVLYTLKKEYRGNALGAPTM